jgi:hypothetical protein
MPDTITMKADCALKAQANLGEDVEEIEFPEGTELVVLKEWENAYLAKNDDGKLFNVKKELVEAG